MLSSEGNWSDAGYHTIRVGKATASVRSLCVVGSNIWAAYRNCVIVLDAESLQIVVSFIYLIYEETPVKLGNYESIEFYSLCILSEGRAIDSICKTY